MNKIQNSIILILISSFSALSQQNDFQSWYAFSVNKKIVKKTEITIKSGLRLRENSTLYSKGFFDVKIKRKLSKRVALASGYRHAINRGIGSDFSTSYRFYSDISYKKKLSKRISSSIRNRWQTQGNMGVYKMTLRQKLSVMYNIRKIKLSPEISTEYFLNVIDGINKLRSTFSFSYPITKQIVFNLAYRIQQEFYVKDPETIFIFEGKISYDL
tara:strand:+ start:3016 stop:3657 length:642 start_codon:yes stop_codon:yes gene_type:complete